MSRFAVSQSSSATRTSRFAVPTATASSSRFGTRKTTATDYRDTSTLEQLASKSGITPPAAKPKLNFLQRLGSLLGSFETGNAVATGIEQHSVVKGVGSYLTGIAKGVGSAITGRDFGQTEKKSYRDILEKQGIHNVILKNGLGFVGDVLLDPTTYFGSFIAKGVKGAAKGSAKGILKAVGKFAPESEQGLRLAGKGLKDAFGKAFVFGYGTSKGVAERAIEVQGKLSKAQEGIVKSSIQRLGTGILSNSQQEELVATMLAGKRAELAAGRGVEGKAAGKAAATSADPLVQKAVTEQAARGQKFAKAAGVVDPYEVYYPGLRNDTLKRFFDGTKPFKVGSEGYRKEFKNLLKDEELIRDPAQAFATREFQVVKDNIVRDELNAMVRQFGKPLDAFKTADEAARAGFTLVKEKGLFGKGVGFLTSADKQFVDEFLGFSNNYAAVDAIAKATGFDAVTSLFKRSVTGLFAPFHVRNFVSGMLQNYEVLGPKALSPSTMALGQRVAFNIATSKTFGEETLRVGEKAYSLNKVVEPFVKRFETSSQYISDFQEATVSGSKLFSKQSVKETIKTAGVGSKSIPFRAARAIGNFIETQQKATAYITALQSGRNVSQALDYAARAGFDYRALTQLESKVLRRIIPFYSFTRKNIELQLKVLGENPQRIATILKAADNIAGGITDEERAQLPDYAKDQFILKTGETIPGQPEIAVGLGTAVEQFANFFGKNPIQRIAATLNPVFKLPLERAFNKDFFRDRPLNEVIEAGEYSNSPQFVKDFLQAVPVKKKNKDGSERTTYQANPYRLQLLRNLPTTRGATYVSAIFSNTSTPSKILNSVTGVKPRPIDLETVQYFRERDRQEELQQMLINAGVLKKFETVYKPKN